jgi:hypothetical protein
MLQFHENPLLFCSLLLAILAFIFALVLFILKRNPVMMHISLITSMICSVICVFAGNVQVFSMALIVVFAYTVVVRILNHFFFSSLIHKEVKKALLFFTSDYEITFVDPSEFTWLDMEFYDSAEKTLASLGFHKVADFELMPHTKAYPEIRHFYRSMFHWEKNIGATIMQSRFVQPRSSLEKSVTNCAVVFASELTDGTFLASGFNTGLTFDSVDGIDIHYFPQDTPLESILDEHEKFLRKKCLEDNTEVRFFSTQEELFESGKRDFQLLKKDRQRKGGFTTEELRRLNPKNENFVIMFRKHAAKVFQEYLDNEF